jgi:predicted HAD superfamily Cof-like phosphohydrolase
MDWFRDVMDFHKAMGLPIGGLPDTELENDLKAKSISLMLEELHETIVAMINNDLVETADGLVDLIYVYYSDERHPSRKG